METISCPICHRQKFTHVLTSKDNINHIKGNFNVVKCIHCSLMLTNPRPNSNEIKKYYPDNYQPYKINYSKASFISKIRIKYPWLYSIIDSKTTLDLNIENNKAKVLEIGCGAGNFLYELKLLHPTWKITGTDLSKKSINALKKQGIDAFVSDLTLLPFKSKSIDIVYGWMIVEHIHHLNQALSEVHRILKNGGYFSFSIPNADSWEFKLFAKNWFALQLPTHLYHFTQTSLSKLLKEHGFQVNGIIHQKTFANILSSLSIVTQNSRLPTFFKNIFCRLLSWNIIYFLITLPLAQILSLLKQSGRLTIIAQKI